MRKKTAIRETFLDAHTQHRYNRQGARVAMKDQNETVHEYTYDHLGRLTRDAATELGGDIDGWVRRIERTYEIRGMLETVTSYETPQAEGGSSSGEGDIVNQIKLTYNDLGRLVRFYQEHDGAVDEASTPYVEDSYDTSVSGSAYTKAMRLNKFRYPNGRLVHYTYDDAINDALNRIQEIQDDSSGTPGTPLAEYAYVGAGQIHDMELPQPGLSLTRGLDRFDRTTDLHYFETATSTTVERLGHGYDAAGNRTYRENVLADSNGADLDEHYTYDGINRLLVMGRGDLNTAKNGLETGSGSFVGVWLLDPTGNWRNYYEDADGNGNWDLLQSRTHNEANEIEAIGASVGTAWADPTHDRAGNMVTLPRPETPDERYRAVYDAWNRLVRLEDPDSESGGSGSSSSSSSGGETGQIVAEYEYDGRHFRIVKRAVEEGASSSSSSSSSSSGSNASADRHFYYNNAWQVVEERVDASTDAEIQYVWGLRYIDDLVLRDRDTDADGSLEERLYAIQDANWNVVALANVGGAIQERFIYSAYGTSSVLNADFTAKTGGTGYDWEFLFTGRRLDGESGLMYYRNRYYHGVLGRFVTRDPIGYEAGDLSLYQYAGGMPRALADPFGLSSIHGAVAKWTAAGMTPEEIGALLGSAHVVDSILSGRGGSVRPLPPSSSPGVGDVTPLYDGSTLDALATAMKHQWAVSLKEYATRLAQIEATREACPCPCLKLADKASEMMKHNDSGWYTDQGVPLGTGNHWDAATDILQLLAAAKGKPGINDPMKNALHYHRQHINQWRQPRGIPLLGKDVNINHLKEVWQNCTGITRRAIMMNACMYVLAPVLPQCQTALALTAQQTLNNMNDECKGFFQPWRGVLKGINLN